MEFEFKKSSESVGIYPVQRNYAVFINGHRTGYTLNTYESNKVTVEVVIRETSIISSWGHPNMDAVESWFRSNIDRIMKETDELIKNMNEKMLAITHEYNNIRAEQKFLDRILEPEEE